MAYFWSADYLPKVLPPELVERLQEVQVDPFYKAQPVENMTVTNGLTGGDIKLVPSPGGKTVGYHLYARRLLIIPFVIVRQTCWQKSFEATDCRRDRRKGGQVPQDQAAQQMLILSL